MSFQSKSEFHFCVVPIWQEDNLNRNQRLKAFQKFEGNEHCTAALSLRWFGLCRHKIFLRNLRKNSSRQKYFEAMQKWNFDFEFKPFFKVLSCSRIWCFISCHSYLIKCILLPINILQSYFNQIINSKQLLKQRGYKTPTSEPPPNYLVIFHSWMQFVRLCDIKIQTWHHTSTTPCWVKVWSEQHQRWKFELFAKRKRNFLPSIFLIEV